MLKCSLHEDEEKTFDMQTRNTVSNYTHTHTHTLCLWQDAIILTERK